MVHNIDIGKVKDYLNSTETYIRTGVSIDRVILVLRKFSVIS